MNTTIPTILKLDIAPTVETASERPDFTVVSTELYNAANDAISRPLERPTVSIRNRGSEHEWNSISEGEVALQGRATGVVRLEDKLPSNRMPAEINDSLRGEAPTASQAFAPGVRVSIVMPTKAEAKNLPEVMPKIPRWIYELIVVDADSTDGTVEIAKKLRPDVIVVRQGQPGKGAALRSGFAAAHGDVIVTLDADGSTDPGELPMFVGALLAGFDFAKGTRFAQGGVSDDITPIRKIGNWFLTTIVKFIFGGHFTDLCYGYNAFWRKALPTMNLGDADGFEIETVMEVEALKAGMKICEVPSREHARLHGKSNLHAVRDGFRVLKAIFVHSIKVGHQSFPNR
jgi:hypothetical protein